MIDITGIDKVELIRALYNRSYAPGMGALHDLRRDMTRADVLVILDAMGGLERLEKKMVFDYLMGRVMKITILGNSLDMEYLYDRDNGHGACAEVIEELKTRPANQSDARY